MMAPCLQAAPLSVSVHGESGPAWNKDRLTIDGIDQTPSRTILSEGLLQPRVASESCEITKPSLQL